jgi:hypothetical protein
MVAPAAPFPSLGMAKRGGTGVDEDNEDKAGEDGEDNYRPPTWRA